MYKIKLKEHTLNFNSPEIFNANSGGILAQYLISLGIKPNKVDSFLVKPDITDLDNPFNLIHMQEGIEMVHNLLNRKYDAEIFVMIDSDTDGWTSSAILINYLKRRYPCASIKYAMHAGKEHGIDLDKISEIAPSADLVIIPDAGSNDYAQQEALVQMGKQVLILDHHQIDVDLYKDTGAILINNQMGYTKHPQLLKRSYNVSPHYSGAGIAFFFIMAYDQTYFKDNMIYTDYLDLAAIGIIADAMNMTALGNNYLAYWGLRNIRSPFIHALAVKQSRGIKNPNHLTKIDVAFYIAPVINGVIRSGTPEDKEVCFRALVDTQSSEIIETEWRGNKRFESLYEYAVRIATNAKSRQDSAKKKAFELICHDIKDNAWDQHNLIIALVSEKEEKKVNQNVTGLIATELVKEFNKPCLLLRLSNDNHLYGGSGRNGTFHNLPNLLSFLQDSNLVEYVAGHPNAFGVFIKPENVDLLRNYADARLNGAEFNDKVYEVDYWFRRNENLRSDILMEFAIHDDLYGNSIPAPKFAFDIGYDLNRNIMIMGKNEASVKFKTDDVDFVIFNNPELVEKLRRFPTGEVTIIGRPSLNEFAGRRSVQIMIEDIEVRGDEAMENDEVVSDAISFDFNSLI